MKQIKLMAAFAVLALLASSCNKESDHKAFIGTWGVEKIEYYNIDYAGHPITSTIQTFTFDPEDINDGIQLIFREDKSGEMRDNNVDTVWYNWNAETYTYDSYIVNPDTTLVTKFTYSYDKNSSILYMNMEYARTFMMHVYDLGSNSFSYENEYDQNYMERAYMKRLSDKPTKAATGKSSVKRPQKPGSFISGR